jgi:alanine-alpha-ketoisovalerate/valine-pyruvate aminotransferase
MKTKIKTRIIKPFYFLKVQETNKIIKKEKKGGEKRKI